MERIRRNERMAVMMSIFTREPNKIFTLSYFCDLFGAAKSTMSEDIDILKDTMKAFGIGSLETVTGAAGGVCFRPLMEKAAAHEYISSLCKALSGKERVLTGDFLYLSDILSQPEIVNRMGIILAGEYYHLAPDFVLTMETKGIPVALMTAGALGVPLVIARKASKVYEGSAVNINYVSGSSGNIETMSLSRRAVKQGQRALIVDDFLKGGGTAKGMADLMHEFDVEVVGMAFVMATANPEKKRVTGEKSLMIMDMTGTDDTVAQVTPAKWLEER